MQYWKKNGGLCLLIIWIIYLFEFQLNSKDYTVNSLIVIDSYLLLMWILHFDPGVGFSHWLPFGPCLHYNFHRIGFCFDTASMNLLIKFWTEAPLAHWFLGEREFFAFQHAKCFPMNSYLSCSFHSFGFFVRVFFLSYISCSLFLRPYQPTASTQKFREWYGVHARDGNKIWWDELDQLGLDNTNLIGIRK